jgi:hypothetical protein
VVPTLTEWFRRSLAKSAISHRPRWPTVGQHAVRAGHHGFPLKAWSRAAGPPLRSTPVIFPRLWVPKMGDALGSPLNAWCRGLPRPRAMDFS